MTVENPITIPTRVPRQKPPLAIKGSKWIRSGQVFKKSVFESYISLIWVGKTEWYDITSSKAYGI
jgi:hypothetical protein